MTMKKMTLVGLDSSYWLTMQNRTDHVPMIMRKPHIQVKKGCQFWGQIPGIVCANHQLKPFMQLLNDTSRL